MTLVPDTALKVGRSYYYYLSGGIRDQAGNSMYSGSYYFSTTFAPDNTAPQVELLSIHDGQVDVPINARIRIRFDEAIDNVKFAQGGQFIVRDSLGASVPYNLSFNDSRTEVTLVPVQLLEPGSSYALTVTGVEDRAGNTLAADTLVNFTTGPGADVVRGTVLSMSYQDNAVDAPLNTLLRVRLNERVDPLSLNASTFWVYDDALNKLVAGTTILSEGNTVITFVPDAPLEIGHQYHLRVSYYEGLKDLAGQDFHYRYYDDFITGDHSATVAPVVEASNIQHGATGVPVNTRVVLRLDSLISPFCVADATTTVTDGIDTFDFAMTLQTDNRTLVMTRTDVLATSTAYTATIQGLCDYAGNTITPVVIGFTTAADPGSDTDYPNMTSLVPAHLSTGVAADTSITMTFDEVIDPTAVSDFYVRVDGFTGHVAGNLVVNGAVATFTPLNPFPGESRIHVHFRYASDLAGNNSYYAGGAYYFDTAPRLDNTPPSVVDISPADGSTDISPYAPIVLTLNESLNANTVSNYNFVLWSNGVLIRPGVSRSADNRTITLTATLPHGSPIAVIMTSDVEDLSGNASGNFSSMFTTGVPDSDTSRPSVVTQYPTNGSVVQTARVALYTNQPLDPSAVTGAFHVVENGVLKPGTMTLKAEGQAIEFIPDSPFAEGALVHVYLESTATDLSGNAVYNHKQYFTVPTDNVGTRPWPTAYSPRDNADGVALNPRIQAQFTEPLDPATVSGATVTFHSDDGTELAATVSLSADGRTITVVPTALLAADERYYVALSYLIEDTDGDRLYYSYYPRFYTGAAATEDNQAPTATAVSPANGATDVPLNVVYRALFDERINPLSFPLDSRLNVAFSSDDRTVSYQPLTVLLPPSSSVTETLPTLQDLSGNELGVTSTTFNTGTVLTVDHPSVVQRAIPWDAVVPVNAKFEVLLSWPIDPATVNDTTFYLYDMTDSVHIAATLSVSADGKVLTLQPDAVLPADRRFYLQLTSSIKDLAGNYLHSWYSYLYTNAVEDTGVPAVMHSSIADGTSDVPLDANLALSLDDPISSVCMSRATINLTDGVDPVGLNRSLSREDRLLLVPQTLLKASTTYTLTVDGLCNYMGAVLPLQTISFTTSASAQVDAVHPYVMAATPYNNATNVPHNTKIELRTSERMDASTVTEQTFYFYDVTGNEYPQVSVSLSADLRTIRIVPQAALKANNHYRLYAYWRLNSGVRAKDLAGLDLWGHPDSSSYGYLDDFNFTTGDTVEDATAPGVSFVTLPDAVTDIPLNTRFRIRLDEPMSDVCVQPDSIYLQETGTTNKLLGSMSLSADRYVLTYTLPSGTLLSPDTSYDVVSGSPLCDYAYNEVTYAGSVFTTGAGPEADSSHPYLTSSTPFAGATDVPHNTAIRLYVSEPLDPTTVSSDTFYLRDETASSNVSISVGLAADRRSVVITPLEALQASHRYRIRGYSASTSNLRAKDVTGLDLWGRSNSSSYSYLDDYYFDTGALVEDTTAPSVLEVSLPDGITDVPLNTRFGIELDEPMSDVCIQSAPLYLMKTGTSDKIFGTQTFSANRHIVTYTLPAGTTLDASSSYQVSAATLCDLAHNEVAFAGSAFTTEAGPDADATNPHLVAVTPYSGATDVPQNTAIRLFVSERLDRTLVWEDTFRLRDDTAGSYVSVSVDLAADLRSVVITPLEALEASHRYRIYAYAASDSNRRATDLVGLSLWGRSGSSSYSYLDDYYFETGATVADDTAPGILDVSLADGLTDVPLNSQFSILLDEPLSDVCVQSDPVYMQKVGTTDPIMGALTLSADRHRLVYSLPEGTTLDASSSYQLNAVTLCDLAHNEVAFAGSTFTTGAGPDTDTTHPYVTASVPVDDATNVPLNQVIEWTISERLDAASVSDRTFYLRDDTTATIVPTTVTLSADLMTVIITPVSALTSAHSYRIYGYSSSGNSQRAVDLAGNNLWGRSDGSSYTYLDDYNFTTQ